MSQYCSKCGRELLAIEEPTGYDRHTGKPTTSRWWKCPKYRGSYIAWQFGIGQGHDYLSDEDEARIRLQKGRLV
jgi:hypothetical protein